MARCRVLELGCCDGANLIPMALGLPESEFVGVDLSARQIADGQATIGALGLRNIVLRQMDIADIGPAFGEFDYIVAHGVYSWVSPEVRDRLLAVCRANLAPRGVAYVSYNAYPGGHLRDMTRGMMLFHTRGLTDPRERIGQARALLKFLAESPSGLPEYRAFLQKEWDRIRKRRDETVYHDELERVNTPVYFYQFVEHAAGHGLQYLSETNFYEMHDRALGPQVTEMLRQAPNQVAREQYLDFLTGRRFRQTLLCHQGVPLQNALRPERMSAFCVASSARPVSPESDVASASPVEFEGPLKVTVSTGYPLLTAAMGELTSAWPAALSFNDLLDRAVSRVNLEPGQTLPAPDQRALHLGHFLLETYASGIIDLHLHPPRFALAVGERPVSSPLARLQARRQDIVTTLRHRSVRLEGPLERHMLLLLDGTRNREALLNDLAALLRSGQVALHQDGSPVPDPQKALAVLSGRLEEMLLMLVRFALLVA